MLKKLSKLSVALFFLLGVVFLPSVTNAYDVGLYSTDDYPWQTIPHADDPNIFREIEIQLCSVGIWNIWDDADLKFNSGSQPTTTPLYSGISGATRPTASQILADHGIGYYYFQSSNSTGCTGLTDEAFGVTSWAYFRINSDGNFYNANIDSEIVQATVPINKNIEIIEPTYATTTATTTYLVQIKFKTPFSFDSRPTTTRHYEIVDAVTGELNYSYSADIPPNSAENIVITATTTTTEGSKYIRAMYLDTKGGIYSEVDEVFFNVATNTYFLATGLLSPKDKPPTAIDCGIFEVGCQVQKAITFLFYPSDKVLDRFSNTWQTIAEKKPFGYVTMTIRQLKNLNMSGSASFTLGTIPFMDVLFTPLRSAVGIILWGLFAIYFYHYRLKNLDI